MAANASNVPAESTLSSSIVNEPPSVLQPRPLPATSRPGWPAVREIVRTAFGYVPTASASPGGAEKSVFHHQAVEYGFGVQPR